MLCLVIFVHGKMELKRMRPDPGETGCLEGLSCEEGQLVSLNGANSANDP